MNGHHETQLHIDFRTGVPTSIDGPEVSAGGRSACTALNRDRIRGLTEADRSTASRQSVPPYVWTSLLARQCRQWGVPLIPLSKLGISHNAERLLKSDYLVPLKSGAEACPFLDEQWGVVYKLFPLLLSGGLGKTFDLELQDEDGGPRLDLATRDATLFQTVEKLALLSEAGALITEIVGLADTGDYLIAKQPAARSYHDLELDRETAVQACRAVVCRAPVRRPLWVLWLDETPWFMSDLHKGNIMRTSAGDPTIIDALCSPIPMTLANELPWLAPAVEDAREWRRTGQQPRRRAFGEGVSDDEL